MGLQTVVAQILDGKDWASFKIHRWRLTASNFDEGLETAFYLEELLEIEAEVCYHFDDCLVQLKIISAILEDVAQVLEETVFFTDDALLDLIGPTQGHQ